MTHKTQFVSKAKPLHSRNKHKYGYDFDALIDSHPELSRHIIEIKAGNKTIDYSDPLAVKALNTAILIRDYGISYWTIPEGALCPPIPGRVDYIHTVAELIGIPDPTLSSRKSSPIRMLDIGTGANGIYSILAAQIYGWSCVSSDINQQSLNSVAKIIEHNPGLSDRISLRIQPDQHQIFNDIIQSDEHFDISVCNPPFHDSLDAAIKASQRKHVNLGKQSKNKATASVKNAQLNFGGQAAELWCNGGEQLFLKKMIKESYLFSDNCTWFSSLISKSENVKPSIKLINKMGATDIRELEMLQGNKITRVLAWTYQK